LQLTTAPLLPFLLFPVFAPSAAELLRFSHALQQLLTAEGVRVVCDANSLVVHHTALQLIESMQRETEGQAKRMQSQFPMLDRAPGKGAASAAATSSAVTPSAFLQFQRESMRLQMDTDEVAARAAMLV
jgi:hypothetical protein